MKQSLLIVEDAKEYHLILRAALEREYELFFASTGAEALTMLGQRVYALALVDIMLPDMSGLQICNYIKSQKETQSLPVILVTAKDSIEDKIVGFDSGADDYLTKPFNAKELQVRVRARLKDRAPEQDRLAVPRLEIDLQKQRVQMSGSNTPLDLTRIEFKLLVCFAQRLDHILSREQLLNIVWPQNLNVTERTVDSHISNLRRKLAGSSLEISAVHGSGYRFSAVKKSA